MSLSLVTGPTVEPLSLAEVKLYCRVDDDITVDDALIDALIVAARQRLDGYSGILGRALISQTWRLDLPQFWNVTRLPLPPLQSVTSVKYYNTSDVLTTVATSVYEVITSGTTGGHIHLLGDQSWPSDIDTDRAEPIQITFVAGYGDSWNDIPEPLKLAMAYIVTHHYDNRESVKEGSMSEVPETTQSLIAPYRLVGFG